MADAIPKLEMTINIFVYGRHLNDHLIFLNIYHKIFDIYIRLHIIISNQQSKNKILSVNLLTAK